MNPERFIPRTTTDGSETLYSEEMQESYHSLNGAVQESRHVFIDAGLKQCTSKELRIFEVGFGTGLNALLTWGEAKRSNRIVQYTAVEIYPLETTLMESLHYERYEPLLPTDSFLRLHQSPWDTSVVLDQDCFTLTKINNDFTSSILEGPFDLIYFDAFAPDKQPEMWEEAHFARLYEILDEKGIMVTYCAKGEVRRRMQRSGFIVERIPGPPGKREMLRASKR